MKFGKSLSNQIEETLPEWRDKFLSYKELKKKLKLIEPKANSNGNGDENCKNKRVKYSSNDEKEGVTASMTKEEEDFIRLLEDELEKFNAFFVEKEEEYIIRQKELQDAIARAKVFPEEMIRIKKEIVNFHGEMVLLENYSALNYTGLVKILKKYDKRTGALIRLPFIQKVLRQPFFTTDLLFQLVKECELMLDRLFPADDPSISGDQTENTEPNSSNSNVSSMPRASQDLEDIEYMESLYMKSAMAALRVLKEIRSGSSTVSVFSLPPLQNTGLEEPWSKIPTLEQIQVTK
ncbi:SPX domain-containing protein 1 [Amborella trichopoda]|uniref:SPX domain-containing protein n=1 Tax=Amborella trichopoda TaxID=13333 RepID=W1P9T7_AMBTC|nr:SPX domain-containing protein 1 [Amborella trichopoda]ERN03750.1 hypothetical protein AMTR_s00078p00058950 [Amborella trichopoda]|eukprot:XP_006842075.1 SPX domain-containing protein 1 [Amborella trichopoda]